MLKNYQQTVKQRRVKLEKNKRMLRASTPVFQPKDAWASKRTLGGVPETVLGRKQYDCGGRGYRDANRWFLLY